MKTHSKIALAISTGVALYLCLWILFTVLPRLWRTPGLWTLRLEYLHLQSSRAGSYFKSQIGKTKRIEFRMFAANPPSVVVSEPGEVSNFVSAISFTPAPPCMSAYAETAAFISDEGTINVSMDDHSMMVQGNGYHGLFEAPPGLYHLYDSYARRLRSTGAK